MRLHQTTIAWLGAIHQPVTLDLDALGTARLIAITGANGAGKSTLCELAILGALYRRTASRGDLADLATGRGAYVASTFTGPDGRRFGVRQTVDAETGLGSSLLTGMDGNPLTDAAGGIINGAASRKVHDAWAKAHLPDPAVVLASQFAAQEPSRSLGGKGTAGLLTMTDTDRRAVVLRAMGAEHYDRIHERGRERLRVAVESLTRVQAALEAARGLGGPVAAAQAALATAKAEAAVAPLRVTAAYAALDGLQCGA